MPLRSESPKTSSVIGANDLASSGKLNPAQGGKKQKKEMCPDCGCAVDECECDDDDDSVGWSEDPAGVAIHKEADGDEDGDFGFYVPLLKANIEARTVTGVVLVPEEVDAQGDVYDAEVIRKAAHEWLQTINVPMKRNDKGDVGVGTGLMHKNLDPPIAVCESYCAPCQMMFGTRTVREGTWIVTVKVNDDKIWSLVKGGKITGFSIGGVAKVKKIETVK